MSVNPLIKAREIALQYNISDTQFIKLQDSFKVYDKSGTGSIDKAAAIKVLEEMKVEDSECAAQQLIDTYDTNKNGIIEFWEFVEHYGQKSAKIHSLSHNNEQPHKRQRPSMEGDDETPNPSTE
mmetsp:Transcript_24752/g.53278  ORF Transcript_24752/g.53278 Transcript_24752/m.53278 type:complete len:124 (-) Transcript_24752:60-431(-)